MVTENDVEHIADLADIGMEPGELAPFTQQFNAILGYFDILDTVKGGDIPPHGQVNVMREDVVAPALPVEDIEIVKDCIELVGKRSQFVRLKADVCKICDMLHIFFSDHAPTC